MSGLQPMTREGMTAYPRTSNGRLLGSTLGPSSQAIAQGDSID